MTADSPLLEVRDLCVTYSVSHGMLGRNRDVRAVSGVSFDVKPGETLGLIGESGCGKSTVARSIVGLQPKRADVILAGACIVRVVMDKLEQPSLTVSDRALRHGLIAERFGS